jgi:hypothetical protein
MKGSPERHKKGRTKEKRKDGIKGSTGKENKREE